MKVTRRSLVKGAMGAPMVTTPAIAFGSQANSAVSFGIVGTGGRGRYVGNHMVGTGLAKVAAICDIHGDRIDLAKTKVPGADGAKVHRDYRDLLADPNVDAVLITTPVFLHAEHFEAAVAAKKHIYCEKPAAPDVARVKQIARAGAKVDPNTVVQWGYQQRFSKEYLKAMEYMEAGKIGDVKLVLSYWVLGNPPPTSFKSPYPGTDPEVERARLWARWTDLSGGPIVEQDCHGVDMLNWYLKERPTKASGKGGLRYPVVYGDWTSDHHDIVYTYPDGKEGWLISIKFAGAFRSVKEQIYGSHGMLETARTYYKLHGPRKDSNFPNADELEDRSLIEKVTTKREITIDAVEHFYRRILENKPYNMTDVAVESTATSILGRMAYEYGREVTWEEMWRSA
jgi:myo-inositol 2-dehydrogenase / D-chiro-inositol 1-dehydrogenase